MREIKFRGKGLFDDKWYHGSLMTADNYFSTHYGMNCTAISFLRDGRTKRHPIEESTVGQYTGLKDKNGVEIYEGDIISFTGNVTPVCVDEGMTTVLDEVNGYILLRYLRDVAKTCEVIGNIHDNPELLEVER